MSRLDSFIRRLTAQKTLLEYAADRLTDVEGPVLELGLGNGRTYDHLRELFPDREIFAFDRGIYCHPSCMPDGDHMIFGEIRETLAFCGPRVGEQVALIHCDLGSGDPTTDLATSAWLSPLVDLHTKAGGFVLSGLKLDLPHYEAQDLPDGIRPGRYHLYRNYA
ncbi:class I SAM-dependent methyltransferase [Roseibium sp. RKSG952]|uniref:class I SAM-dependent methyltransferase n=1 Tax=Roseibium sp. RKSG952 TaxID=2529384 RepID=UPI0012BCACEE|nr:class I SAM-dependent methyltransferase [Roseibium sp. RKSG952]MTH98949.1 hypothetical protein [Roseibium sp. RKSG952]